MKKIPVILLLLIQAATLVLMTCGREGPLPPPDKTPPYIKSTIPANNTGNDGTAGFALDGSIVITFTKDMDPTTINNQTVTVIGAGGIGPINGSVVYNNGSAIFTPAQKLSPNTAYTVMINSSVSDSFGIIMGNTYTFIFTTETLPDTVPPTVLYTSPEAASTDVAVNSNISIQFSKPVTSSTLTFQLVNQSTGSVVSSTMNYSGTTAIFTPQFAPPAVSLDGNTVYGATVKAGLQDLVGNQMVSDYTWTFSTSTGFDTTPPFVTATTPTAGVSGVSINTNLMAAFSEPVDQTTINITLFSTATGTPVIVPYIDSYYDNGTNSLYYMPKDDSVTLAYNTLYTARVSGVQDLAKNVMPDMTWSFTTELAQTSTSIDSSNNPTQYLSPVTFTATVSSNVSSTIGIPTGTVTFRDNNAILPNGTVALSGDTATYTISTLALGTHTITATYDGDSIFATSTSAVTQTVGQGTTTTTISAPTATYGSNGIVTVTVSSASGVPIGNVSLSVDGGVATTQALSNGSTVFTIVKPGVGTYNLSAIYTSPAQSNFNGSTASGALSVVQGATTTSINAPTITYGVNGNVTVLVSSASGTPTGNVSLSVDGVALAPQALNGSGSATFLITAPSATTHSLTASYAAQPSFLASTASGNLTVNQAPTTMTISAPSITAYGVDGTVIVTVSSGTTLLPVGNVQLVVDNGTPMTGALSPGVLLGTGVVSFTITQPSAGSHTLAASYPYPAGGNFGPSTAPGTLNVGGGATTMTISAPTITYGAPSVVTVQLSSLASGIPTGSVTLSDTISGATTTLTQTLSNGSAVFTISNPLPPVGTHNLVATYAAQGNFLGSTKSGSLTVNKAATTTSITSSANPSQFNNSVTFTATVAGSGAVPTGTVTFKDGATVLGTGTLSGSGVATFSTSTLSVATHSITAAYGGDTSYNTSTSSALSQIVNRATTTTILTSSTEGHPVTPGTLVTFTATLNPAAATGTVTFFDNGVAFPSGTVALAAGTAAFGTTALSAGAHNITAAYNGDTNYATSTSNTVVQSVTNGAVTITVVSSLPTSTYGNSVTFTATVSGSGAIPTGTVTFKDGATTLGSGNLSGGSPDQATFATAALTTGAHSITAVYNGDASYSGGQVSAPITQTVIGTTTTSVVSSLPTSTYGNSVTFTATVTGTGGTPGGTVSFYDGAALLGTGTLNGGSPDQAAFTTSATALTAGVHSSITAVYNGNTYFTASTSPAITQTVNKAATTTSITSSANPSQFNNSVTFTATVSDGTSATATGTITFMDGAAVLGTGALSGGVATYTTSALTVTTHSITAAYGGDASFNTSTSSALSQTVNRATTTTILTSSTGGQPVTPGTLVTFTATVTTGATGTVTFFDNGIAFPSGTVALAAGTAAFGTTALSAGAHNITAAYSGDTNYLTSTSNTVVQSVTNGSVTITVVSSLPTSTYGNSVTFTATVSGSGAIPTGTVTFKDGITTLGTSALSGGSPDTAIYSTLALAAGAHSITAVYNGDASYSAGQTSSPYTQTVIGTTTTSVVSSALTSTYGNSVTFTATVASTGGTPAGTVSFYDGAGLLGTGTLNGGSPDQAAFTTTTTALNAGVVHSITAVYNGNAYFTTSTSAPISQNVNPAPTTMSISAPSVASGASGTVYVTVSSGILLPTGNVHLSVDGGTQLIGALSSGVATFSVGILSVGNHSLSATYAAQGNFGASSASGTLNVGQASSTTSVLSSNNPSVYGDSVTFTATVTPSTATGTVTFKDGSATLGSSNLSGGVATFSTTSLTAATHTITATYNGDTNYGTSTSSNLQQSVAKATPVTSLASSSDPSDQSTYGQSVTFTATVAYSGSGSGAVPTGTVTFKDGSTTIGSGALSGGVASFSTSTLTAAVHTIKAVYNGDTNYSSGAQDALSQTVNKASTTTTVTGPPDSSAGTLTFTASVAYGGSGSAATGSVTFTDSTVGLLCTGTLSGGTASCLASVVAGPYSITATYSGDTNYSGSASSPPYQLTVN